MDSNRIQGAIKGSPGRILEEMKEVNRDRRAMKDSQIQVLEENMSINYCAKQSVIKQVLYDISS